MRIASLSFVLILWSCGGGSSTGPVDGTGTFTAFIDGSEWVSATNQATGVGQSPGFLTIQGTQVQDLTNTVSVTLLLGYITGPGTYPLGVNQSTTAGGTGMISAPLGFGFGSWSTNLTGAAGTVTITSLTAARIVGTFSFTAPPQSFSSTTGTKVVTGGHFDMPLPEAWVTAPAADHGSRVTATVEGNPWNGATIIALGADGVFGFNASTDTLSITLQNGSIVAAGNSYPIGGPGGSTMIAARSGTAHTWTSVGGVTVGSVTILTLSGNRATGMFTATLNPGPNAPGPLVIAGGTFDVRIDTP